MGVIIVTGAALENGAATAKLLSRQGTWGHQDADERRSSAGYCIV
jgi:NAD(P)-dependent dehydrogenase (short-subunit alcohol dehydrogenase family)